jgi:hypothetical protein
MLGKGIHGLLVLQQAGLGGVDGQKFSGRRALGKWKGCWMTNTRTSIDHYLQQPPNTESNEASSERLATQTRVMPTKSKSTTTEDVAPQASLEATSADFYT